MKYDKELRATLAFLDPVRAAIDNAEISLAITSEANMNPQALNRAAAALAVAARNLNWCENELVKLATKWSEEQHG